MANFQKVKTLCNRHPDQETEHIQLPEAPLMPSPITVTTLPKSKHCADFLTVINLPLFHLPANGIKQRVLVCLTSFTQHLFGSFTRVVVFVVASSLLIVFHCVSVPRCIYPF